VNRILCEKKEKPDNIDFFNNRKSKYAHIYNQIVELNLGEYIECSGMETSTQSNHLAAALYAAILRSGPLSNKLNAQGCKIRTAKRKNIDGSYSLWITKYEVASD